MSVGPKIISEQEHNGDQLLAKNATLKVRHFWSWRLTTCILLGIGVVLVDKNALDRNTASSFTEYESEAFQIVKCIFTDWTIQYIHFSLVIYAGLQHFYCLF